MSKFSLSLRSTCIRGNLLSRRCSSKASLSPVVRDIIKGDSCGGEPLSHSLSFSPDLTLMTSPVTAVWSRAEQSRAEWRPCLNQDSSSGWVKEGSLSTR